MLPCRVRKCSAPSLSSALVRPSLARSLAPLSFLLHCRATILSETCLTFLRNVDSNGLLDAARLDKSGMCESSAALALPIAGVRRAGFATYRTKERFVCACRCVKFLHAGRALKRHMCAPFCDDAVGVPAGKRRPGALGGKKRRAQEL